MGRWAVARLGGVGGDVAAVVPELAARMEGGAVEGGRVGVGAGGWSHVVGVVAVKGLERAGRLVRRGGLVPAWGV